MNTFACLISEDGCIELPEAVITPKALHFVEVERIVLAVGGLEHLPGDARLLAEVGTLSKKIAVPAAVCAVLEVGPGSEIIWLETDEGWVVMSQAERDKQEAECLNSAATDLKDLFNV